MDAQFFGEAFVTLFVIMDPLGTIPVFLALTGGFTMRARARCPGVPPGGPGPPRPAWPCWSPSA
jgi:MarC family integral membrane protein